MLFLRHGCGIHAVSPAVRRLLMPDVDASQAAGQHSLLTVGLGFLSVSEHSRTWGFDAGVRRRDAMALFVPAAAQTFGRGVLSVLTVVIALEPFDLGSAAVGRLEVRTLAREEFLAGVTGNPESVERAEEVVSTRLQAG